MCAQKSISGVLIIAMLRKYYYIGLRTNVLIHTRTHTLKEFAKMLTFVLNNMHCSFKLRWAQGVPV